MTAVATGRGSAAAVVGGSTFTGCAPGSACPVEGRRESTLSGVLELHAESLDPGFDRLGDRDRRARRVGHAGQLGGLTGSFGGIVLDLDRNVVADPDAVSIALV